MFRFPKAAEPLVAAFSVAFTCPTFQRVAVLILGAILSLRHRTVAGMLRSVGPLAEGHWSDFHRVFSRRVWSCFPLGKVLATMVLELIPADQRVVCAVDDTTLQHKGAHVYGNGCHRDACRSSHNHKVSVWGHKWVTLAINVKFPFASRPWSLPVLCALYRPVARDRAEERRHKTPTDLAMQLMATLIHWFPERKFVLLGDGGFSSHELARFCYRHRQHVTLVSRCQPKARLYEAPPTEKPRMGRPRLKGDQLPAPSTVVKTARAKRCNVNWYGGKTRRVELISRQGNWYRAGAGLVPMRWVFVRDLDGTHRDEYFFCTDATLAPEQIVSLYTGRWSIEVMFQEMHTHLGLATPRNWSAKSVLRTTPCLLGLFSVVSLIFHQHARHHGARPRSFPWYAKAEPTFCDAITCVRRLCWKEVFQQSSKHAGVAKLPRSLRIMLLDHLSQAA